MNHETGRLLFGLGVGLLVAFGAYQWITDPMPRTERQLEETVVIAARNLLESELAISEVEIVDPLAPDRKVGKSYVYRSEEGWEVSGYYRRDAEDLWHPYLMALDNSLKLTHLKISDPALVGTATDKSYLEILP
jgi:hypothetical protein